MREKEELIKAQSRKSPALYGGIIKEVKKSYQFSAVDYIIRLFFHT